MEPPTQEIQQRYGSDGAAKHKDDRGKASRNGLIVRAIEVARDSERRRLCGLRALPVLQGPLLQVLDHRGG